MSAPTARLNDFGDVLTDKQICQILGFGPRYFEKLITLERKTGIACTPKQIPGMKRRYLKEDVRRWLKGGVPAAARRDESEAA
jgi:hypothetical protein